MPVDDTVEVESDSFLLLGSLRSRGANTMLFLHIDNGRHISDLAFELYHYAVSDGLMDRYDSVIVIDVNVATRVVSPKQAIHLDRAFLTQPPPIRMLEDALDDAVAAVGSGSTDGERTIVQRRGSDMSTIAGGDLAQFSAIVGLTFEWKAVSRLGVGIESVNATIIGDERFNHFADLDGVAIFVHIYSAIRDLELTTAMCRNAYHRAATGTPCLFFNWLLRPEGKFVFLPILISGAAVPDTKLTEEALRATFAEASRVGNHRTLPSVRVTGDLTAPESYKMVSVDMHTSSEVPNSKIEMLPVLRVPPNTSSRAGE
jgi:hypothetical protein